MMSKELLKKAGILGITFGLMASPLAFANTDEHASIEENQDIMAEEEPAQPTSTSDSQPENYDAEDLTTDHGDQGPDVVDDPQSTNTGNHDEEMSPEDLEEKNSGS